MPFKDPAAQKAWSKQYYQANAEAKRAYARNRRCVDREGYNRHKRETYHRGHKYGNCPICNFNGQLNWDHDHITGKFRDWICRDCNMKLGIFERNHVKFEVYLKRFK